MATTTETNSATQRPSLRIKPETRAKFEHVKKVKRWNLAVVADEAIDALLRTDPELKRAKREPVSAA